MEVYLLFSYTEELVLSMQGVDGVNSIRSQDGFYYKYHCADAFNQQDDVVNFRELFCVTGHALSFKILRTNI